MNNDIKFPGIHRYNPKPEINISTKLKNIFTYKRKSGKKIVSQGSIPWIIVL